MTSSKFTVTIESIGNQCNTPIIFNQPRRMAQNLKVNIMAKTTQSNAQSNAQSARAKTAPNAPKISALVHAVQPSAPVGESVSAAQTAAMEAVKLYVTAGKREASVRESATESMATFIRTLHGDIAPKDIAQMLYGHGTTKSKKADEVVYLRSVIIYNAYNKVFERGVYEPADKKAARLAEAQAKKADEKADESTAENAPPHEYSDAEKLSKVDDLRLEYMLTLVARELAARGYDVQKMARAAVR